MGRDQIEEQMLLDLSRTQREALACRWPRILVEATRSADLAEAIRRTLSGQTGKEPA